MTRDPETRDLLAAAYVLGTLRGAARRRFAAELRRDPALRRDVGFWEERLEPLYAGLPEEAPPARVWQRIERRLAPARTPFLARLRFWRWLATGLAATTVALAVLLMQPGAPPADFVVAVLQDQAKDPVWSLRLAPEARRLVVETLRPPPAPGADRAFQLWVLPPGAAAPAPGPLLPAAGRAEAALSPALAQALAGAGEVLVSVEPPGGAPAGVPTGPVLYAGALRGL